MADPHFFQNVGPFSLKDIASHIGATIHSDNNQEGMISDVAPLDEAGAGQISFLDNIKYLGAFKDTKAEACIIHEKFIDKAPTHVILLISDNPYLAYAKTASMFYPENPGTIDERAIIDPTASVGEGCSIAAGAYIGPHVKLGNHCVIHANANITHSIIGDRVTIHQGASIGQDGFGFATNEKGEHLSVPQIGRVIIEDDVNIGANTTIDRGSGPDTIIGKGTRIDNLVQIGHNVQIGNHCIIVAQVGISGSTKLGNHVVVGGQAAFAGHLHIGDGVQVMAQSGVIKNIEKGQIIGGSPAIAAKQFHRQTITLAKLTKQSNKHDD